MARPAEGFDLLLGRDDPTVGVEEVGRDGDHLSDGGLIVRGHDRDALDACVVLADGARADEDELIAWCREGLAAFKRPRAVLVVDDLPKTATGKIQRFRLREELEGG